MDFDRGRPFNAFFIRAPKISKIGNGIRVLASFNDEPILLGDNLHIVSAFHPEIGNDYRIHEYFINQIDEKLSALI